MEITHFGDNRSRITVVYSPLRVVIQPRIIDGTHWLLFNPDLLGELQKELAVGHRAADLSSSTWQTIVNRPYLLEAHPITRHGAVTIYRFGHKASSIALIRTNDAALQVSRVGSANLITADHESVLWLKQFIDNAPRRTQAATLYFREHGLTLTRRIQDEQLRPSNGS